MNERIKELAEHAREYARNHVTECKIYGYYMEENEFEEQFENKFAELIVRECIQAIDDIGGYNEEFHMNVIKNHFGVE